MQVNKSKLYTVFFYFGADSKTSISTSYHFSYSDIEKMKNYFSTNYRFCLCVVPELDKVFVKDPDVLSDNLTHSFKGIKCLIDDYPFLKEVLRYAKKTD